MKETYIKSFEELIKKLEPLKKRNTLIFRGQSDKNWSVIPKAGRKEFHKNYSATFTDAHTFKAWKRYAKFHLDKYPDNDWDWLAIAQHHGLGTRLLDWSKNPLVAAYFACYENFDKDGVIYYYAITDINEFERGENPFEFKNFAVFFPSGLASRIINQRGLFTISGKPEIGLEKTLGKQLHKIVIDSKSKNGIIRSLDFYGINKLSLYQDLDSLSDYLNDYLKVLGENKREIETKLLLSDE
uniref:FRG domain-containing protein n=1 Tax=uncultured Christiangramia sp. TaxID=503836 RepID=UPI002627C6EC|nr:FRG domain-containing protein [uncultured Christiangramia sp.]